MSDWWRDKDLACIYLTETTAGRVRSRLGPRSLRLLISLISIGREKRHPAACPPPSGAALPQEMQVKRPSLTALAHNSTHFRNVELIRHQTALERKARPLSPAYEA